MHHDPIHPGDAVRRKVDAELEAIEADPAFQRAPVMRRLLRFLVTETLGGRGDKLKSYAIAVEALGREADFDPQTDSYPRVQVARLRKLLDAHYAHAAPVGGIQIRVPSGGYAVEFVGEAPAPLVPELPGPKASTVRYAALGVAALAVLLAALFLWRTDGNAWRVRNFPTIYLAPATALDAAQPQRDAAVDLTTGLGEGLDRFTAIDVVRTPASGTDYRIDTTLRAVPGGTRINITLTSLDTGRVVWSRSGLREPVEGRLFDVDEVAATVTARLAQPAGVIHNDGDQRNIDIDTPYGCWLALRSYWRMMPPEDEPKVRGCVTAWVAGDPKSAMAHGAWSWFLAQDALKRTGEERADLLAGAHAEALKAVELQPNDPGAQYSVMRAALYLGLDRQARAAADRVIYFNPNNPEFMAGVGMFKIMMGDADGEAVLRKALSLHPNPPPWVQSGLFFAAVSRDDAEAALSAAQDFQTPVGPPLQHAMMAMALARTGRMEEAQAEWQQVVAADPHYAETPESIFDPLPLAPRVLERSIAWLLLVSGA
ncbi:hypothetical protein [Sphingosinicella microcystinivorans]|uniref:hypothetical protein n=1 Tax=Sphingosinicella microcystinivorans TaxID=335406 RepID=UPI0022F38516|nr:hypothetical protein [Sphingosinicella microcystinivorans]WBX82434.1 hypothetical protein PE061_11370 [Sphingosinicella microcystinivorans]